MDVPRDAETFVPDVDGLVEAARTARLVFVTSPNNPTGDLVPAGCIERLCEACPGIVLADEAYIEFAGEGTSVEGLLAAYPNLVVLHTLSKAFCLAGARIGYVLGSPSIIAALQAVRQPYSVNVFSQAAALTVVRNREAFEPIIGRIVSERGTCGCGPALPTSCASACPAHMRRAPACATSSPSSCATSPRPQGLPTACASPWACRRRTTPSSIPCPSSLGGSHEQKRDGEPHDRRDRHNGVA